MTRGHVPVSARLAGPVLAVILTLLAPTEALAYGGPGSMITGIGALLAAVATIAAALFGFLWFPLKRLVRRLRGGDEAEVEEAAPPSEDLARE